PPPAGRRRGRCLRWNETPDFPRTVACSSHPTHPCTISVRSPTATRPWIVQRAGVAWTERNEARPIHRPEEPCGPPVETNSDERPAAQVWRGIRGRGPVRDRTTSEA